MNHKKLIIVAIRVGLIGTLTTLGWELPTDSVSHPECEKGVHWDKMSPDCKINLTEKGAVSKDSKGYGHLILSALWGTSYNTPHTKNSGSHPSLDIVSAEGTPVKSIQDGTVILAGERPGYGKSITIEHALNGEKIYSNYSHLEKIEVSVGKKVAQGEYIGTVGRTGFTIGPFGYHLDFQITTADSPSHPYGLHDCEVGYYQAVNGGNCRDKVEKYTIDPVEFFAKYSSYNLRPLSGVEEKNEEETITRIVQLPTTLNTQDITAQDIEEITQVQLSQESIPVAFSVNKSVFASLAGSFTQWSLAGQVEHTSAPEENQQQEVKIEEGLPYEINWVVGNKTNQLVMGKMTPLTFFITDQVKNVRNGNLDERISLRYNSHEMDISPSSFGSVVEGKKTLFIQAKKTGYASITIMHGEEELGTEVIYTVE